MSSVISAFAGGRRRIIAALLGLALLGLLGGCSVLRLAYDQADDLAYWWLDGYADFDGPQTDAARRAIADWFAWHRATQVADYAALLAAWRTQAQGEVGAAQVCAANDAARERLRRGLDQAAPALADLARRLGPAQLNHVQRRLAKGHDEFRAKFLQADPAARQQAALERTVERAESFYGPLDERQRALLAAALPQSPFDPQAWFNERQALQQQALAQARQLQAERADAARWQAWLKQVVAQALQSPRPAYRAYQQRLTEHNCALIAQLHNSTGPAQRRHLAAKLKAWEDDLRALAVPLQ